MPGGGRFPLRPVRDIRPPNDLDTALPPVPFLSRDEPGTVGWEGEQHPPPTDSGNYQTAADRERSEAEATRAAVDVLDRLADAVIRDANRTLSGLPPAMGRQIDPTGMTAADAVATNLHAAAADAARAAIVSYAAALATGRTADEAAMIAGQRALSAMGLTDARGEAQALAADNAALEAYRHAAEGQSTAASRTVAAMATALRALHDIVRGTTFQDLAQAEVDAHDPESLAYTVADNIIATSRRYIRQLIGGKPFVIWAGLGRVTAIEDRDQRIVTIALTERGGQTITGVYADPSMPALGSTYVARRTVKLNLGAERGPPEFVRWTMKVPGNKWLYFVDGNDGLVLWRVSWPPSSGTDPWGEPERTAIPPDTEEPIGPLIYTPPGGGASRQEVVSLVRTTTVGPGDFLIDDNGSPLGPGVRQLRGYDDWGMSPQAVRTVPWSALAVLTGNSSNFGPVLAGTAQHQYDFGGTYDGVRGVGGSTGHLEVFQYTTHAGAIHHVALGVSRDGGNSGTEVIELLPSAVRTEIYNLYSLHGMGDVTRLHNTSGNWYPWAVGGTLGAFAFDDPNGPLHIAIWDSYRVEYHPPATITFYAPAYTRVPGSDYEGTDRGAPLSIFLDVAINGAGAQVPWIPPPGVPSTNTSALGFFGFAQGRAGMPDKDTLVLFCRGATGVYRRIYGFGAVALTPRTDWEATPIQFVTCVSTDAQAAIGQAGDGGYRYTNDGGDHWDRLPPLPTGGAPVFFVWSA